MTPGAAAADKVWYKSSLMPRTEVLGQRRRMLVNARHSWVGDACLARGETSPTAPRDISDCRGGSNPCASSMGSTAGPGACKLQATPNSSLGGGGGD